MSTNADEKIPLFSYTETLRVTMTMYVLSDIACLLRQILFLILGYRQTDFRRRS